MHLVGFKPMILPFGLSKTVSVLDHAVRVIGSLFEIADRGRPVKGSVAHILDNLWRDSCWRVLTALKFLQRLMVQHRWCTRDVMVGDAVMHRGGHMMVVVEAQHGASRRHDASSSRRHRNSADRHGSLVTCRVVMMMIRMLVVIVCCWWFTAATCRRGRGGYTGHKVLKTQPRVR